MKQKTNSKLVETVKRDVNEMLKYSTSTLPCKPHCIRQQEELQVQQDRKNKAIGKITHCLIFINELIVLTSYSPNVFINSLVP